MRKSRYKIYNGAFMFVLAVDILLCLSVYRVETKAVRDTFWENPMFGLCMGVLLQGLLALLLMAQAFEWGRDRGLKELGDDMFIDPDDYEDLKEGDERIMVTEKHTLGDKRRTFAKYLKKKDPL